MTEPKLSDFKNEQGVPLSEIASLFVAAANQCGLVVFAVVLGEPMGDTARFIGNFKSPVIGDILGQLQALVRKGELVADESVTIGGVN